MARTCATLAATRRAKLQGAGFRDPRVERRMSPRSHSGGAPAAERFVVQAATSRSSQDAQAVARIIARTARNATNATSGSERPNLILLRAGTDQAHVGNASTHNARHAANGLQEELLNGGANSELEVICCGTARSRHARRSRANRRNDLTVTRSEAL